MNKGTPENLGFLSRMSDLELRLKQSEDERLALEDKFNKLLNARKSEEEMHLYLLRENYSQLLRQDKMRCDRNDMILQALANVESRASMLTAKTDRLRLLRQHYESFVGRHYPVLKKTVGRHRSVESLVSDVNDNPSLRSLSSSPRLVPSYSPSSFTRSPSITRRNSLVVSNSEILDPVSFKISNKMNLSSHVSRRRLFDSSTTLDKTPDCNLMPNFISSPRDGKTNVTFKNSTSPFTVSNRDLSYEEQKNSKSSTSLFLPVSSLNDYTEKTFVKDSDDFTKKESEQKYTRTSPPSKVNLSDKFDKLSPKPFTTKPLTKSSSFSTGTSQSRIFSNHFLPEKHQPTLVRRPSSVYHPDTSRQLYRSQSTTIGDLSSQLPHQRIKSSLGEVPYFSRRPSLSERSKSPLSERAQSPFSERRKSPQFFNTKSPLTVVDDIFKKYLINYDRRYLSDPISESKYGKYLYPLSHYDYNYNEDQRNQASNLLDAKYYDKRTSYYDDETSLSSRGSIGTTLYKPYGSRESLFTNDQPLFHQRNISYFDDRKDWKEWNHYRNRYEYPPTSCFEGLQTKLAYTDDLYHPIARENLNEVGFTSTSYTSLNNLPTRYSHSLKIHDGIDEYNHSKMGFENLGKKTDYMLPYEKKISGKQDFQSRDIFKIPQTPKKVSFSNEFLYDDKSDTEVSSNIDETTMPAYYMESSKGITNPVNSSLLENNTFQMSISRETGLGLSEAIHDYNNTPEIENGDKVSTDQTMKIDREGSTANSFISNIRENKEENQGVGKEGGGFKGNETKFNNLEYTDMKKEETITEPQVMTNSVVEQQLKEPTGNENYLEGDKKSEHLRGDNKVSEQTEDTRRGEDENNVTNTTLLKHTSPADSQAMETVSSPPNINSGLNAENESPTNIKDPMQSEEKQFQQDKEISSSEKPSIIDSFVDKDFASRQFGSNENLERQKSAEISEFDTTQTGHEAVYSEEQQQMVYDQVPHEQIGTYDDNSQQYSGQNTYESSEIPQYPNGYNKEQYNQSQQQYDQYNQPENQYGPQQGGYDGEEYAQNGDVQGFDQSQEVYETEQYATKDYEQPEVYSNNQYEQQQHPDYNEKDFRSSQQNVQDFRSSQQDVHNFRGSQQNIQGFRGSQQNIQDFRGSQQNIQDFKGSQQNIQDFRGSQQNIQDFRGSQQNIQDFRGSQQNIQDYQQPIPQQQFEDERYATQDQYEQHYEGGDQNQYAPEHYPPENVPQDYGTDQPYEGEYPPDYSQQQYDPNYQDPSQVPQVPAEQYKADYDAAYQEDPQYGYDQVGNTYDDQYQQPGPDYEQQQQPPYDQYEQQPPENYDKQYQGPPDQYGNYDYTYDQTAPVADQTYLGDEQQSYAEGAEPYDYNEPLQQPFDGVVQPQPYDENVPYEQSYPDGQNVYGDEQQVFETTDYAQQNVNVPPQELPTNYDYPNQSQSDGPLLPQQSEPLYETEAMPYTGTDISSRDAVSTEPAPTLNQILESDPDSSIAQGVVTHEDSSDFDFSTSQK